MIALYDKYPKDWVKARQIMAKKYYIDEPAMTKTIWNANLNGLCGILAMLYGEGDFQRTLDLSCAMGDVPSKALELRLKAALKYARENEDTTLILSGGQGFGEDITEAKCMENYLTAHGISQERLVLEEKSTSTKENLKFSDELTGCSKKNTGILSNNFHVYRAVKLAEKLGYKHPYGIAAVSDPIMQVHYVVREVAALVKEKLRGNI